jgi:hypothetical protein
MSVNAGEMEFEAAHYTTPEMEEEWEAHEGHPYSTPEMEWEMHEGHPYSSPYSTPEMEEEWEMHEGSHYSSPYSTPEMEWEMHEGHPYSSPEMEEEWEMHEGSHYSSPYSTPEMEWETHEGHPYSSPEMEWEMHEGQPYSSPYSTPEMEWEDESDRFFPLVAKAATKLLPHAIRIGRNLFRGGRRGSSPGRAPGRPRQMGSRNQQISALFHQLGRAFAQGEQEAASHEAHLFGANEFETEVAANEVAHQAALSEVMAAEASHTESESEAQALLGAALPISMRVMGGRVGVRHLTPTLLRVNAQLVLSLHRQGAPGRQLLRVMPSIQRRTMSTLAAIKRSGQPVTPALAANVMRAQAARVLTTPHICGKALTRNMVVRQQTVAPRASAIQTGMRPGLRKQGGQFYRPRTYRTGMRTPMGTRRPAAMRMPGGPVSRPRPFIQSRPVARQQHSMSPRRQARV